MIALGNWRLRPRLWPTLITLLGLVVLLGLGTWQLERLAWKQALIAELKARAQDPPMALPARITDAEALEFRPLRLQGRFLHDRELYLEARSHEGQPGLHVVTPLLLDDGRALLVDRGWVPLARRAPGTRRAGQLAGRVTVAGQARIGGWTGYGFLRPDNDPEANVWLWMDLAPMAESAGLSKPVTGLYLVAGPAANPGGLPIGRAAEVGLPNDHLQYAITWYALALALLVVYLLQQSRPGAAGEGE
jgi:surfeit locus 1 family protein